MNALLPTDANPRNELGRALAAIPGMTDLYRRRDEIRRSVIVAPTATVAVARQGAIAALAAAGAPDGLPADLGAEVLAAEDEGRRLGIAEAVRREAVAELEHQIATTITEHVDQALATLADSLTDLLDQARPAVAAVGDARTAEAALRGKPTAIAAWQRLDALADRYALIRRAQTALYRFAPVDADHARQAQREHGEIRNRPALWSSPAAPPWPHYESRPEEMLIGPAALIWMVTAGVEVWLPTATELLAEVEQQRTTAWTSPTRDYTPGVDPVEATTRQPDPGNTRLAVSATTGRGRVEQ